MGLKGDKAKVGLMLSGQQIPIEGADLFITQPTIKQIVNFGEDDFLIAVNWLVKYQKYLKNIREGNSELEVYSDFQLLLIVLEEDLSLRQLIDKLFLLIFPDYTIKIENGLINFYIIDEETSQLILVGQLHPYNFEAFQNLLCDLFIIQKDDDSADRDYNPANDAAAKIAAKLEKGRQKRAKEQGPQSLFGIYCSVLSIGLQIDINVFFNYTPFQIYDAYRRFFDKQSNDFYQRVSTMPFMDVSSMDAPKEWTRHLY